jgi:hypothetical protein
MTAAQDLLRRTGTPPVLLWLALALAVGSQAALALGFGGLSGNARAQWTVTLSLCAGLSIPTAILLFACWRTRDRALGQNIVFAIALAGIAMRLPYFGSGPMLEDDHFRYLLDGAMTARGMNPYTYSPLNLLEGAAPQSYLDVASAGRAAVEQINFQDLRTIYPGTAQLLFALAHMIAPWGIDGLRVVIVLCEIVAAVLCLRLLDDMALPRHLVALVWCNPLLAFSLTGQAHIDAALGPLLLCAVRAIIGSAGITSGAAIGAAVGVKLWPVMLVPVILRSLGRDRRAQLGFLVSLGTVTLLVCAPLLIASLGAQSGLVAYARSWHMNNMPYAWVSYAIYLIAGGDGLERYLRATVAIASAAIGVALAWRPIADTRDLVARLALVAASVFYLSPAQFPWYVAWFVPFAVLSRNWALLSATAALPCYFLFFPLAGTVSGDLYRFWLSGLHVLPVIIIALAMRSAPHRGVA